jgi:D-alanyl-lipoteichoic acid acyltransferase DltB (MBOAT superfamily)
LLFTEPTFLFLFLPILLGLYFVRGSREHAAYGNWLLLAASVIFYAKGGGAFTWLMLGSIAFNYWMAIAVDRAHGTPSAARRLACAVTVNLVVLGVFKYANFFADNVNALLGTVHAAPIAVPRVLLPIGISFFTFMGISYVIDIYRGEIEPAGWLDFFVYLSFFPHLVAGPIVRGSELLPQIRVRRDPRRIDIGRASWLIFGGLFKKMVLSSFVASAIVDPVFGAPSAHSSLEILIGVYAYAVQIWADFSGYTDIAIGIALLLGFKFPENFNSPYTARSLQDFWRRWHITLSYWLRDYLYVPLGGNRDGRAREVRNVVVTMTLGGLWHGANWTFVVWGVLHGVAVAFVHWFKRLFRWPARPSESAATSEAHDPGRSRLPAWIGVLLTFHFVTLLWVFFRAPSIGTAAHLLTAPFTGSWAGGPAFLSANVFIVLLIAVFLLVHRYDDHRRIRAAVRYLRPEIFWPILALLWIMAITVSQGSSAKFIYFDF